MSNVVEWTIEANPGSVSARKAATLYQGGINRISLGVQSWDDRLLEGLGREHNAAQAETSFEVFRDAGFTNISIDLMFGIPGQAIEHWQASLEKTISLQPEHVSCYCLTYEEDTEFFRRQSRGELRADPEADAEFFTAAFETLEAAGYSQYEISNYARPGSASVHNQSVLGRGKLSGNRAERILNRRAATLAERLRLSSGTRTTYSPEDPLWLQPKR